MLKVMPIFISVLALIISGISLYFQFLRKRFAVSGLLLSAAISEKEEYDSVYSSR